MSQDMTLTRPIKDVTGQSTNGDAAPAEAPRRRLGSWQVAPGGTDAFPTPVSSTGPELATAAVPDQGGRSAASTLPLATPLAASHQQTATWSAPVTVTRPAPEYVPSASDLTLPFSEREAKREEWEARHARASTVQLRGASQAAPGSMSAQPSWSTAPMAGSLGDATVPFTGSLDDVTVPLVRGATVPISPTGTAELSLLRRRRDDDPDDVDAALELALALQEDGQTAEASSIFTALHAYYEANDAPKEAAQIRRLLGNAPISDIGNVRISDIGSAPTAEIGGAVTVSLGGDSTSAATAPMASLLGRTTAQLSTRTIPLTERVAATRDGRPRPTPVEFTRAELLPRAQLVVTEPIPMMEMLSHDAGELFAIAEEERSAGHLRAAIDTLNLAIAMSPDALGLWIRSAEIRIRLGHRRKARASLEQLRSLAGSSATTVPSWMVERLLLHTVEPDVESLERVVGLLIEAEQHVHAATYASALIQHLDGDDRPEAAIACATRMATILPGHTKIALEGAILAVRHASHGEVIDLWEAAVAHGAEAEVAKSSMAASVASASEDDHWRLLAESLTLIRADPQSLCRDAYLRTAEAAGVLPVLKAGRALVLHAVDDAGATDALAGAAGDRHGTAIGRAAASIALAERLSSAGKGNEYVAAVRTTLTLMANQAIHVPPDWLSLTGVEPNLAELSTELGEALLDAGDAAGAVEILSVWHKGAKQYAPLVQLLAEAYARIGQVGSSLTILDELGIHHRKSGQLDEMAAVLRQMSRLAPTNVKVKSRLIDAYLQRGFVAEARAELIQRADLEEQAGHPTEACKSLQRAADLSWNLGFMNEAFSLYDRLLAIDPEDVGNRSALVNLYLQVGRLTEAAEHQRAVVDLALRHGRRHEAIAALHQVIGLTPDDMTAYYQLGELLSSMGEYQQAEKVYRRIVLMMPDDAVAQAKATSMAALKEEMIAV